MPDNPHFPPLPCCLCLQAKHADGECFAAVSLEGEAVLGLFLLLRSGELGRQVAKASFLSGSCRPSPRSAVAPGLEVPGGGAFPGGGAPGGAGPRAGSGPDNCAQEAFRDGGSAARSRPPAGCRSARPERRSDRPSASRPRPGRPAGPRTPGRLQEVKGTHALPPGRRPVRSAGGAVNMSPAKCKVCFPDRKVK